MFQVKECPDRYVVCAFDYQKIRDMVAKTLLGENVTHLETIMNVSNTPTAKHIDGFPSEFFSKKERTSLFNDEFINNGYWCV